MDRSERTGIIRLQEQFGRTIFTGRVFLATGPHLTGRWVHLRNLSILSVLWESTRSWQGLGPPHKSFLHAQMQQSSP